MVHSNRTIILTLILILSVLPGCAKKTASLAPSASNNQTVAPTSINMNDLNLTDEQKAKLNQGQAVTVDMKNSSSSIKIEPLGGHQDSSSTSVQSYVASSVNPVYAGYANKKAKFELQYPTDWQKEEIDNTVMFLSRPESKADKYSDSVTVAVQESSDKLMSLVKYTQASVEQIKQVIDNYKIISQKDGALGSLPAYYIEFTGKNGDMQMAWFQAWTVKDGQIYILSFAAEANSYQKYLPIAKTIFASFKFSQ